MSRKWRFIKRGASVLLILCSFYWGNKVLSYADTMSIKYEEEGLSKEQIDQINTREDKERYVTGWNRTKDLLVKNTDLGNEIAITLMEVYGDMTTLIPSALTMGTFVEKEDKNGCIISEGAAEELFGNRMALGSRVKLENMEYIVRGILDSKEEMLFITSKEGNYLNLEFRYKNKQHPASDTKTELGVLGLPAYACFTEGNLYAGVARLFMGFPFLVIWLLAAITVHRRIPLGAIRNILLCVAVGIGLLILSRNCIVFSEDYIPSRVSDFAFWIQKWKEIHEQHLQLLFFQMWYKENILFHSLKFCFLSSAASCFLNGVAEL